MQGKERNIRTLDAECSVVLKVTVEVLNEDSMVIEAWSILDRADRAVDKVSSKYYLSYDGTSPYPAIDTHMGAFTDPTRFYFGADLHDDTVLEFHLHWHFFILLLLLPPFPLIWR